MIAKKLGLTGDAAREVRKTIKRMVKSGELAWGPSHLVYPIHADRPEKNEGGGASGGGASGEVASATAGAGGGGGGGGAKAAEAASPEAASPEAGSVDGALRKKVRTKAKTKPAGDAKHFTGTFRRAAGGFGFVRPEGTMRAEGRDADVFIPANQCGDAANGDIVSVRLETKRGRMGKLEGRILDVVERATSRFVGVYFEQAGMGMVQIDGKIFTNPIFVGDPGAKGAQPEDKVVLEMVRFPSHVRDGEGVIVEVLGPRGQAGVDTMSIIYEFNLPGEFDEDVLENARRHAEKFDESIGRGRRDLTDLTIITIDPIDARDFDDAISLERLENGHWLLGVHIADVSHFVEPKTPLDREAYDRATSVYLPDRVIPMLPEIISNNLASLQPHKVRYAVSAMMEFTEEGARVATDVFKSAIKSRRRFTYEEVDQYLAEKAVGPPVKPRTGAKKTSTKRAKKSPLPSPLSEGEGGVRGTLAPEVDGLLARMHELAMIFRARRFQRGALELSMPEMKIDLDADGRVVGAHLEKNTESHQIIEEFMLSANIAVAETLEEAGLLFLRRVHGSPDPRKMKVLTEFVREIGFEVENLENRFELQKLLDAVKGDPREHALNYATLRSMQRAVYSPEEEGHYALAADCYCHFTSPIRRYPDLTVHRLIDQLNRGRKPEQRMDRFLADGDHCSEREQRAADAERELKKVKLLDYMSKRIGTELDGVITGVENFGLFIRGIEIPAEGFVHIGSLNDDYYRFDRAGHVIAGHRSGNSYRLGDTVRVAVAAVDVDARELDFRLISRKSGAPAARIKRPAKLRGKRGAKATKPAGGRKKTKRPGKSERRSRKSTQ
ncbi:MAG: RNB domain-containing ribonuclease [Pirellulales bacterium]|nr:RNB domain-containing ribonuclease [Pirellulales bacterium]